MKEIQDITLELYKMDFQAFVKVKPVIAELLKQIKHLAAAKCFLKGVLPMGSIMDLKNLLDEEINLILSSDYEIAVSETVFVPTIDDPLITYPNLESMQQKVKLIETCVLYIDIRRSTELNLTHRRETVIKLYSAFIRSMVKAAKHYGGSLEGL